MLGSACTQTHGQPTEGKGGLEEPTGPETEENVSTDERNPSGSALSKNVVFHPRRCPAAP